MIEKDLEAQLIAGRFHRLQGEQRQRAWEAFQRLFFEIEFGGTPDTGRGFSHRPRKRGGG